MDVVTTVDEVRLACSRLRGTDSGRSLGLVPTMGALHEGHLSLVRAARESCGVVVCTIFVNPLQFGPGEDLQRYPRTFEEDCLLLQAEGVDLLFAPGADAMYPAAIETWVEVGEIGKRLDGASRPGHFRGVATVVSKLFHLVGPDRAFFGQKDAAQVAVLRAMVRDLNFDVELVICPVVRDRDGLALSSRNRYLSRSERETALAISRSLRAVEKAVGRGERSATALRGLLEEQLQGVSDVRVDYAEVVDPETLEEVTDVGSGALVAVAAWVGGTRLIDNVVIGRAEPTR